MDRIGFNYQYDRYNSWLNSAQTKVDSLQSQLSSGKRIQTISDDPFAASSSISARALKSSVDQYTANLTAAQNTLNSSDNAMSQLQDLMRQANVIAVKASNGTNDAASMQSMASQIRSMQKQILNLGNTRGPNAEYLFAGTADNAPPFTITAGALTFSGNTNGKMVQAGPNQTLQANTTTASGIIANAYNALDALQKDMTANAYQNISSTDLQAITSSQDAVNQERGGIGAQVQFAKSLSNQYTRQSDELAKNISQYEDADFAQVATQYQAAQTAYQAALASVSSIQKLSLVNYIQ